MRERVTAGARRSIPGDPAKGLLSDPNIGTIFDHYTEGASPSGDISWNAELEHAVHTQDDYWSLEVSFPLAQFSDEAVETGTVWGANLARIRIANASDYGQWVPTYGSALEPGRFWFLVFE